MRGQERPTTASRRTAHGARRTAHGARRTAHVEDKQPIHSWATYIGKTEQDTEYFGLRLDRQRRLPGGVNGGEVPFREYYDLRADPYRLTNRLHGASTEQERRPGVPESARRLTAARAT
ncbi:hypothetical protein [Streptomyces sp. RLB3-6]|uniref:hypothetical protein n=1 Tax=Streptomyces sp. RLB3-6 TaxID=2594457 RepID=UPI00116545AB|nr:hypothetical protein [Streptomyces sp. RLB3-6]QDN90098.1 hypothetical protein FNV61_35085 [Streptomyces sp. RLB3-6]